MELNDLRSRMYRVGNYIKESTSKSLDGAAIARCCMRIMLR